MKRILKFLTAAVVAVAFVSAAHADTIVLASYGTGQNSNGANNSALAYLGYDATTPITAGLGSGTTYNLTSGLSPWAGPIAGSNWVSQDPNSSVGLGSAPPNGYYSFTTNFSATPGTYNGSLDVYADDTAEVFLNGNLLVNFASNTVNGPCAQTGDGPTCVGTPWNAIFSAVLLNDNVLTIVEWQSGGSAAGVDFAGTLESQTVVPEPGSFLLLGTGLVGLAKFMARKAHSRVANWFFRVSM